MNVGGASSAYTHLSSVELIDPFGINAAIDVSDYPAIVMAGCSAGRFHCSGTNDYLHPKDYVYNKTCFYLDEKYEWIQFPSHLNENRMAATCTSLYEGSGYWIIGGGNYIGTESQWNSSDMLKSRQGSFEYGPVLPPDFFSTASQCIVKINDSTFFISGLDLHIGPIFYLIEFDGTNATVSKLPQSPVKSFWFHGCGFYTSSKGENGLEEIFLVIAGGSDEHGKSLDTTSIYSTKSNSWISGPTLPRPFRGGGYVSDETFPLLLIGGCADCEGSLMTTYNDIMSYNPDLNTFEILPGKLNTARAAFAASIVQV